MLTCSGCGSPLRVREEYFGRTMKCPRCGQIVQPGAAVDEAAVVASPMPDPGLDPDWEFTPPETPGADAPSSEQRRRPVMLEAVEDDVPEVRPVRRGYRQEDSGVRRPRPADDGYMPCPKCGNTDAERVHFTFWGSFHITNMVCHVQCPSCGTCYNGRTGRSNMLVAILCVIIPLVLIIAIIATLAWWLLVGSRP
jgi:predicted RNA-binding Zn-ribbon protein involved in translation (DUF1610 family)